MSLSLRVTMLLVSLLTLVFIVSRVRSSKVRIEDSVFWVCLAAFLLIVSIFPQIFIFASAVVGTEAPVNFVFLFFIFVLLIMGFNMNMRVSRADTKIKELTQQLAIEKLERHESVQAAENTLKKRNGAAESNANASEFQTEE